MQLSFGSFMRNTCYFLPSCFTSSFLIVSHIDGTFSLNSIANVFSASLGFFFGHWVNFILPVSFSLFISKMRILQKLVLLMFSQIESEIYVEIIQGLSWVYVAELQVPFVLLWTVTISIPLTSTLVALNSVYLYTPLTFTFLAFCDSYIQFHISSCLFNLFTLMHNNTSRSQYI